ncbi:MAG: hypothetical protein MGG11_01490 [Trichodesmium sp. MAG_R03]|nr:hypothetical protein [Trichodesmium sp. MAG_R03]
MPTARFTKGGFKVGQLMAFLAKIGKLKIVCSRALTPIPLSVTVIKDSANGYFLSFVVEVLPEVLPKTDNSVGIDLGIKTKASCRNVSLRDMKRIFVLQCPYMEKKLMHENH